MERLKATGANVIGLDWTVDIGDARQRLGETPVQGNIDPCVLFGDQALIREAVLDCIQSAGPQVNS